MSNEGLHGMSYLYFELVESLQRKQEYDKLLRQFAQAVENGAKFLLRSLQLLQANEKHAAHYAPGVIFSLGRHVAEEVDAISVLLSRGCTQPCKLHMRSAFEGDLGIRYILSGDSERRALAYLVSDACERIRRYEKLNPESQSGKQLRQALARDKMTCEILDSLPSTNFDEHNTRLREMLQRAPFSDVYDDWRNTKRRLKRRPSWHAQFDGPATIRDLAFKLERGGWYEFLYSDWSGRVHAGTAMNSIAAKLDDSEGDTKALLPLRHPTDIQTVYGISHSMAVLLGKEIADNFLSPVGKDDLQDTFAREIKPLNDRLKNVKISAEWR